MAQMVQCCSIFGKNFIDLVMDVANFQGCKGIRCTSEFEWEKLLEVIRHCHHWAHTAMMPISVLKNVIRGIRHVD